MVKQKKLPDKPVRRKRTAKVKLPSLMEPDAEPRGLCHRCEHRILHIETDGAHQPRCECGDRKHSVIGCYMYKPVAPCALGVNSGDRRPAFGPAMISARMHRVGLAKGAYHAVERKGVYVAWFQPETSDDEVT